ncbi:hypothetical protein HGI30_09415 [Paenibacillus albicereus]|uniref:Alpha/beta hydrolase n=1 Tax=Paenibacillus albicereus TaxID=2726185 RepID=A0A6H2GWH5_9BACL|nr:hypothetical protein [Paenibacillus albicereus]QJC51742.1 hypothetical protein HGI30_09415 [Paenibacillus albicereus]
MSMEWRPLEKAEQRIPGPAPRRKRLKPVEAPGQRDGAFWRRSMAGVWTGGALLCAASAQGLPLGFGPAYDWLAMTLAGTAALGICAWALSWLMNWLRLPVPRRFAGGVLTLAAGTAGALLVSELRWTAALPLAAAYALAAAAGGAAFAAALPRLRLRRPRPLAATLSFAGALLLLPLLLSLPAPGFGGSADDADVAGSGGALDMPGRSGAYTVLTYGSGTGRQAEFAEEADIRASAADASALLPDWGRLEAWYWGFEPERMPLNGTLWLPDGDGPFPLALIVHGNHIAQQRSDAGYAYLGEMLASKGYAAVSVDENFLNFSPWTGIPDDDMKLRAWLLLRHLEELRRLSGQPEGPLSGKLDASRTLLIGHSRGGQAAAMAADAGKWFPGDAALARSVAGVAALAPTDTEEDGRRAELEHASYLTLHGSRDADLTVFYGERQYGRVRLEPGSDRFKAAVYVEDANHSRFNADWGTMDHSLPGGLLLSQRDMLAGERQRQLAAAYVGAFADAVLGGDRAARAWLMPEAQAVGGSASDSFAGIRTFHQFAEADERLMADFEREAARQAGFGVTAEAAAGSALSAEPLLDRNGDPKGSRGAVVAWGSQTDGAGRLDEDGRSASEAGSSESAIDESGIAKEPGDAAGPGVEDARSAADPNGSWLRLIGLPRPPDSAGGGLSFAAANLGGGPCSERAACRPEPLQLQAVLRDRAGVEAEVAVADGIAAVEQEPFLRPAWLDAFVSDGKYDRPAEPARVTIRLPLAAFRQAEPRLDTDSLASLELRFRSSGGGPGRILLDDFSWYPASSSD